MNSFEHATTIINAFKAGRLWTASHADDLTTTREQRDDALEADLSALDGDTYETARSAWLIGYSEAIREWRQHATEAQLDQAAADLFGDFIEAAGDMEAIADRETRAGYHRTKDEIMIQEAAKLKGVSEQAIRDILRDEERRKATFPAARFVGTPQRGAWYLDEREVEAWQPRKYPRG